MRILLKGTIDQIREACSVLAKPRDRTRLANMRAYKNEKNKRESELMRAAYFAIKDDPSQRIMTNAFASAIYGERTEALIDAAKAITGQR